MKSRGTFSAKVRVAYVDQLKSDAEALGAPLLTGASGQKRRDQVFDEFISAYEFELQREQG